MIAAAAGDWRLLNGALHHNHTPPPVLFYGVNCSIYAVETLSALAGCSLLNSLQGDTSLSLSLHHAIRYTRAIFLHYSRPWPVCLGANIAGHLRLCSLRLNSCVRPSVCLSVRLSPFQVPAGHNQIPEQALPYPGSQSIPPPLAPSNYPSPSSSRDEVVTWDFYYFYYFYLLTPPFRK